MRVYYIALFPTVITEPHKLCKARRVAINSTFITRYHCLNPPYTS